MSQKFWDWYEKRYSMIAPTTAALFLLQIVHLYWMTTNVVLLKATGSSLWDPNSFWNIVIALVDYTEIPAIISSSLLYIYQFRQGTGTKWHNVLYLFFINSQWLHIFWITDEVIYEQFVGVSLVAIPLWLSWVAISIDYLELPVMYDTIKKAIASLRHGK